MTPLSRLAAASRAAHEPLWPQILRFSPWHGFCLILTQGGCFYTLPFVEIEDNVPPTITISSPAAGEPLVISSSAAMAWVAATDPDDSTLSCQWFVDGYKDLGAGIPIVDDDLPGCYIYVENDPDFDGRTLRCIILDASAAFDEIRWPIDVLEEGI